MNPLELLQTANPRFEDDVTAATFSVESLPADNSNHAREAVRQWLMDNQGNGWLRYLDRPQTTRIANANDIVEEAIPYCGEFVSQDGTSSLHLRFQDGTYALHIYTEEPDASGLVLEEERLSSSQFDGASVRYRVAWKNTRINGLDELRPTDARFAGFEPHSNH